MINASRGVQPAERSRMCIGVGYLGPGNLKSLLEFNRNLRAWMLRHPRGLPYYLQGAATLLRDLKLPLTRYTGGGVTLYIIGHPADLNHWITQCCGETVVTESLGSLPFWKVDATANALSRQGDLVLLHLDPRLAPRRWAQRRLAMPTLISQVIPLPPAPVPILPLLKNGRTSAEINKLDEFGYTSEVTRSRRQLEFFYHDFYVPHIADRYGAAAWIMPFEEWINHCAGADLVLVRRDQGFVSGAVVRSAERSSKLIFVGVRGADPTLLKQGVVGAVYYYVCLHAQQLGSHELDLGRALPFLNDGVLFFKKKWGSQLGPNLGDAHRAVWLEFAALNPRVAARLADHPPILQASHGVGELVGLVVLPAERFAGEKELRGWLKRISDPGLRELRLILIGPGWSSRLAEVRQISETLPCPVRIALVSGEPSTEQMLAWPTRHEAAPQYKSLAGVPRLPMQCNLHEA